MIRFVISVWIDRRSDSFGLMSQIQTEWIGLSRIDFLLFFIQRDVKCFSDSSGMTRNSSDSLGLNSNPVSSLGKFGTLIDFSDVSWKSHEKKSLFLRVWGLFCPFTFVLKRVLDEHQHISVMQAFLFPIFFVLMIGNWMAYMNFLFQIRSLKFPYFLLFSFLNFMYLLNLHFKNFKNFWLSDCQN